MIKLGIGVLFSGKSDDSDAVDEGGGGEFYGRASWVDRVSAPSTEKCLLLIR